MSKGRKVLIKSAVSGILLSLLIYQMDGREFLRLISSAKLSLLFPALVLQAFSIVLSIFRWRIILDNFAIQVRFGNPGETHPNWGFFQFVYAFGHRRRFLPGVLSFQMERPGHVHDADHDLAGTL